MEKMKKFVSGMEKIRIRDKNPESAHWWHPRRVIPQSFYIVPNRYRWKFSSLGL
jgi:hypothetical protein